MGKYILYGVAICLVCYFLAKPEQAGDNAASLIDSAIAVAGKIGGGIVHITDRFASSVASS